MQSLSYWEIERLNNPDQCIIVGGGLVGLSIGYFLKMAHPELPVTILERGILPSGASTKNAGFACFGSVTEIQADLSIMEDSEVIRLIKKRYDGLQLLQSIIPAKSMQLHFLGGYEVFRKEDTIPSDLEIKYINQLVGEAIGIKSVFKVSQDKEYGNLHKLCIFNPLEGQLNPAHLMETLTSLIRSMGVNVLSGITVESIDQENQLVITDQRWKIPYHRLAIATNGLTQQLFPELSVTPARNQVLITHPINHLPYLGTFHCDGGFLYFRNYGQRLILGGGRNTDHAVETTTQFGLTDNIQNYLQDFLHNSLFPNCKVDIDHWWSGIMGLGNTKEPIVKMIDPTICVGVRLGGMGIAIGSQIGKDCAELLMKSW